LNTNIFSIIFAKNCSIVNMDCPIRFLGSIKAGFPSPASDYMENRIDLNSRFIRRPTSTFFFETDGDSMADAHIPHGSLLVVDRSLKPKNNSVVIAVVDGEFTVKFLVQNIQGFMLVAANPKYKNIRITEGMDFTVWGVVTAVIIDTTKYGI
jgi:DNA polymerase V